MSKQILKRAIPNEQFQVILEFSGSEYRIFDTSVLCKEKGWNKLAYPQHMKTFSVFEDAIFWPDGGQVDASYLYQKSRPIDRGQLEHQVIRLSYKNQAPTSEDTLHHVYAVFLAPYSAKPFRLGESIGGGITDRGGGYDMSLSELLAWPEWKCHFELSGCSWAALLIESLSNNSEHLLNVLIVEACKRNGLAEETGWSSREKPLCSPLEPLRL
ncbi:DUF2442 domain-containing protein [Geomonas ferrireducens]|uniref:DUF2442 domain-containing protein n=1 Tax=Geomonas ferrireducens TaxID=2570227 RepID=UPI0010A8892A|nr:DUF2442 domain-containing protein [Geomonas ferrireducens]